MACARPGAATAANPTPSGHQGHAILPVLCPGGRFHTTELDMNTASAGAAPETEPTIPAGTTNDALPVHFFTIVLNGEPFIRYHETMLAQLPFRWHWHVIEGVAALRHDTAWSAATGGRVSEA